MFKFFWFFPMCVFGYLFITTVGVLYERQGSLVDYLPVIQHLSKTDQLDEAASVSRFVASQKGDLPNTSEILQIGAEIEAHQSNYQSSTMEQVYAGFIKGETDTTIETTATIISDFLVWGDIRDLGQQGFNHYKGTEVDELVVLLSGIGLAATVATFFPEPSSTITGSSVKLTTSLLKALKRSGSITSPLSNNLLSLARNRHLDQLRPFVASMTTMSKTAPKGTLKTLVRSTKSVDDVKTVASWAKIAPDETVTLLASQGDNGLAFLKAEKIKAATHLPKVKLIKHLRTIRVGSRFSKFIVKDGAFKLLSTFSLPTLAAIGASSLFLFIMCFYNLRQRKRSVSSAQKAA